MGTAVPLRVYWTQSITAIFLNRYIPWLRAGETPTPQEKLEIFLFVSPLLIDGTHLRSTQIFS